MKFKINTKSLIFLLFYFVLFEELIIAIFSNYFNLSVIRYFSDLLVLLALILNLKKQKALISKRVLISIIIYAGACLLSALINKVDIILFLWAIRNTFRFILIYYICINTLTVDDVSKFEKRLFQIQNINYIIILIEFFVFGLRRDCLGGIFGVVEGCNGPLNILFVATTCLSISKYIQYKDIKSRNKMIYTIIMNIIFAAFSELKVYYLEIALLLLLITIINKLSLKRIIYLLCSVLLLLGGIKIMIQIFPEQAKNFESINNIIEYANYSGSEINPIIGRGSFYNQINQLFFLESNEKKIIGIGFGNAEMSSFSDRLTSSFYKKYGYLEYRNLSSAMLYLETGLLGLISYIMIFISIIIDCKKNGKANKYIYNYYFKFVSLFAFICMLNVFYNSVSRREIAYIMFLLFSFSTIIVKERRSEKNE